MLDAKAVYQAALDRLNANDSVIVHDARSALHWATGNDGPVPEYARLSQTDAADLYVHWVRAANPQRTTAECVAEFNDPAYRDGRRKGWVWLMLAPGNKDGWGWKPAAKPGMTGEVACEFFYRKLNGLDEPSTPSSDVEAGPILARPAQAAKLLGISRRHLANLRRSGRFGPKPIYLGAAVLFRVSELRDWSAMGCPDEKTWRMKYQTPKQAESFPEPVNAVVGPAINDPMEIENVEVQLENG
jgi:predicted DNA-binding transcriptional regulator AlpA